MKKIIIKIIRIAVWMLLVPITTITFAIVVITAFAVGEICHLCGWHNNPVMIWVFDACKHYQPRNFKTWVNDEAYHNGIL